MTSKKAVSARQVAQWMRNPRYRLEHSAMYWILSKEKVGGRHHSEFKAFSPFPHQKRLYSKLFGEGWRRILVPKARRMGFSTAINLAQMDFCINHKDFHSRIVDQTEDDAKDKLVNRVEKAWNHLHYNLKVDTGITDEGMSGKEIRWSNGSRMTASISGRGSEAAQFLHVSELGPIDFKDSNRADEIIDGAFPAADGGIIVVESTAKGPIGHFKRLCDEALAIPVEDRTIDDWHVLFFAWWEDPRHWTEGNYSRLSAKNEKYLKEVEKKIGRELLPQQKLWYHVMSTTVKNMKYEYPSTLAECWEQPVEGAIYANLINEAKMEDPPRLGKYPIEAGCPCYTIWDLGAPENTRCIVFQLIAGEIRIVKAIMGGFDHIRKIDGPRKGADWAKELMSVPTWYARHILPHDGSIKQYTDVTYQEELQQAGLARVDTMARGAAKDPWKRINQTYRIFNRFVFNTDDPGVKTLIDHLSYYHTTKENDGVSTREVPKHDFSSHHADAFGSIAQAIESGKCDNYFGDRERPRGFERTYERRGSSRYTAFR